MAIVSELAETAIATVLPQAQEKEIDLKCTVPNITVQLDRSKIERTIVNLLSNAIKFTPNGGKVEISAQVAGSMIEFKITDTGPGIPDQYQQLIFERYERIPETKSIEGTGLGLSICKAIVESHKGLIGVKSSAGGSEFWFNIPLSQDQKQPIA
jgi:signal transduction histidine kinase